MLSNNLVAVSSNSIDDLVSFVHECCTFQQCEVQRRCEHEIDTVNKMIFNHDYVGNRSLILFCVNKYS